MSELAKQLRAEAGIPEPERPPLKLALPEPDPEPLIGDITHGPFANPLFKRVLAKFGKTAFARSSACMEFESFLKSIGAGGETCLEIGTYQGSSAIILSQYFKRVICVSVDDDPRRIIKREIVAYLGIRNIEFHDVRSNAEKKRIVDGLEFDFAYSDGDHANDCREDFELVKRCGKVLMHEAWCLQPSVWNLCHSLPANEVTWADYDCFAYWQRKCE
jgi:hypothetical protein